MLLKFICSFFLFGALTAIPLAGAPNDWISSPVEVVSENVNVSVGEKMALVVGRYWYQYNPKFDDKVSPRVAIYYATFVPKGVTDFHDLLEVSQVKLMLNDQLFLPDTARVLSDEEVGPIQVAPKDAAIAWFTFQIPRELAKLRFAVLISHFQPHYHYEGKTIAAYWPWLPNLEDTRKELGLIDKDFVITVEALPHVMIKPVSVNTKVEKSGPTSLIVHPAQMENIAVSVGMEKG